MSHTTKDLLTIQTYGCKVNYYDSLLIKQQLQNLKIDQQKKTFILNSCAVTAQAGIKIRKQAKKLKHAHPNSLIVVTGCGAQVETSLYENIKEIDLVVGNSDKQNLKQIIEQNSLKKQKVFKSNIFKSPYIYSDFVAADTQRTRAFLKIQDGCDSFCTFCIIPFARGKSKSLPMSFLTKAINSLHQQQVQEVVLTGVHIGDYKDGDQGLDKLIIHILKHTKIPRIRLTSLEPIEITDELLACYSDTRICPHFHISLQSANSSVLKAMKRQYNRQDVEKAFKKIETKCPQAFVGMDVIAGFPCESDKDFEETYQVLLDHAWTNIHVFPYSPRAGTYAAKYPSLPSKELVRRAGLLRHLSDSRFVTNLNKQVGTTKKVLLFNQNNQDGLSRDYWRVHLEKSTKNQEQQVVIKSVNKKTGWLQAGF